MQLKCIDNANIAKIEHAIVTFHMNGNISFILLKHAHSPVFLGFTKYIIHCRFILPAINV